MQLFFGRFVLVLALFLAACQASPPPPPPPPPPDVLKRPSKSGAIAITGDDRYVVQVNPENDSISIFRVSTDEKIAELPVGDEPVAVVIAPDNQTAYVANRAAATVVKVSNISTNSPSVVRTVNVGSEPTGLALSPTGARLVVAEFGESRVSVIDTASMGEVASRIVPSPRAVAVSNDGDDSDSDERVVVPEFYGRTGPGAEASDSSRRGAVRILKITDLTDAAAEVVFQPLDPGDFAPALTAPNQLSSVAVVGDKFYVTATGASPDFAPKFNENVFPLLLIGTLGGGSVGVVSLADEIKKLTVTPKSFMADLIDLAAVGSEVLYLTARGADAIQRVVFTGPTTVTLGITTVPQIDLLGGGIGCQNPIGVVTPHDTSASQKMWVNCWVSRTATVVNLTQQKAVAKVAAAAAPAAGKETEINKGRRFYFTGTGRWSNESWSSCGSCHPDGLSDNITWRFAAGPRQSTSMDGSFSHGPGPQKQRVFNWTGIFDEMHDFERNTRDVSGGIGAIVTSTALDVSSRIDIAAVGGLAKPLKDVNTDGGGVLTDWDEINEFVKTIRPPRARRHLDAASVARGRDLFANANQGNCASCHGGAGWTLSRIFWPPSAANNAALLAANFSAAGNPHTKQVGAEPNGAGGTVAPPQVACVLRKTNTPTFGVPGDTAATNALELKAGNPPTNRAQGEFAGYNIPSLYGLQLGAPFLHHGQAKTLPELFATPWNHHLSGNPVFAPSAGQVQDLVNFLLSIDAATSEVAASAGSDQCPAQFP